MNHGGNSGLGARSVFGWIPTCCTMAQRIYCWLAVDLVFAVGAVFPSCRLRVRALRKGHRLGLFADRNSHFRLLDSELRTSDWATIDPVAEEKAWRPLKSIAQRNDCLTSRSIRRSLRCAPFARLIGSVICR
jgi:hypothetical protein